MKLKKFLLLFLLLILLIPNNGYGESNNSKAYLVLTNKITLEDMESMDNLQEIIKDGNLGLMNTRGTSGYTGVEGFLTINASRKAYANNECIEFNKNRKNKKIENNSLGRIINLNDNNNYTPNIGAIGDSLHEAGLKTAVYGNSNLLEEEGNSAALIPMDSKGLIDYGNIDNITKKTKNYSFDLKTDYSKLLSEIKNSPADLIVVDTGDLERLFKYRGYLTEVEYNITREKVLKDIDLFMKDLINMIDSENSLVMMASPNNGDDNVDSSKLSPLLVLDNNMKKGTLISSTTKRDNIVSNMDIGPTIAEFLGSNTENMSGKPINGIKSENTLQNLVKENKRINTTSRTRYKTLLYYGVFSIIILLIPLVLIMAKIKMSEKFKKIINIILTIILTIPSIFLLTSLLKPINIEFYLVTLFGLIILSILIVWITRKSKKQVLYISGFTVALIFLDLLTKGRISMYSVLSHDPIIGARYYGIGNEMIGLLLGSITIFSKKIVEKTNNFFIPGIICIISLVLIANPSMGANVGGTLTFAVALSILIIESSKLKMDYKKIILMGVAIIIFMSIIGYIDINSNGNTTHLGNTILLIENKGFNYLKDIILRKVLVNIRLIGTSFWTYLLLVHMFAHSVLFNKIKYDKMDLISIIAGASGAMIGFLLNDSGIILAAICMNMITLELYINGKWKIG